jgi:hypothetical protein
VDNDVDPGGFELRIVGLSGAPTARLNERRSRPHLLQQCAHVLCSIHAAQYSPVSNAENKTASNIS